MMKLLMKIAIVILMMLVVVYLKYNDRKIRAKRNFATLKNFMTC